MVTILGDNLYQSKTLVLYISHIADDRIIDLFTETEISPKLEIFRFADLQRYVPIELLQDFQMIERMKNCDIGYVTV